MCSGRIQWGALVHWCHPCGAQSMKAGYEMRMNESHLEVIRNLAGNKTIANCPKNICTTERCNSACEDHWQATEKQPNSERVVKVLAETSEVGVR